MIKRIISFLLTLLIVCSFASCNQDATNTDESTEVTTKVEETKSIPIEQTETDYIVRTDWMTFYFSKKDFNEADLSGIATEAVSIMYDIRSYLNMNYTLAEADESVCYFDSTYRNDEGQRRSMCFWNNREIHCRSLSAFVHEYTHMVSENNADLLYHPEKIFIEGLAEYISLNFYDIIASKEYIHFKAGEFETSSNASDHQMICALLSNNSLPYNAKNYKKAVVAIAHKYFDISQIDKDNDFYQYYIGYIFVNYCIAELGGLERFISAYCDSVTLIDIYGKSLDELVIDACANNTAAFYTS